MPRRRCYEPEAERVRETRHASKPVDFAGGLHVFSRCLGRIRNLAPELRPPQPESGEIEATKE
jgi:hypothetical protein